IERIIRPGSNGHAEGSPGEHEGEAEGDLLEDDDVSVDPQGRLPLHLEEEDEDLYEDDDDPLYAAPEDELPAGDEAPLVLALQAALDVGRRRAAVSAIRE